MRKLFSSSWLSSQDREAPKTKLFFMDQEFGVTVGVASTDVGDGVVLGWDDIAVGETPRI